MSTQRIFENIMDQFNQEEEENEEEEDSIKHSDRLKMHNKSPSLTESTNNKIKEKLFKSTQDKISKNPNKKRKRDEFGYFINDDDNSSNDEENEEKSDSNENKEEDNKNNSSQKKEEEEIDNENEVINSLRVREEEEEKENNEDKNNNDENDDNKVNEGEFQEEENDQIEEINKDNEDDNINNEEIKENEEEKNGDKIEDKKDEQNIDEVNNEKENEENDIINELYNKSKIDNLDQPEGVELFRMGSFRPNPVPGSPKFSKNAPNNETLNEKEDKQNNTNNENKNLENFTETIETKIEGDKLNVQNQEKSQVNNIIPIYTHDNNIISLGKIPSVKGNYSNNNEILNQKVKEETQKKSNENEEKAEEDFLKREELKIQKNKESTEKKEKEKENKNVKDISNKKDEEEGKENVTEDEEDEIKRNNIINSKNTIQTENNPTERNESIKGNINESYSVKNSINNGNNTKRSNNEIEEIKVKDLSIKLLTQYQKDGNSIESSEEHSNRNSAAKNRNIINHNKNMGVNRNIYSKKIADRNNNNKNYKKIINHNVIPRRAIYESPSDKNYGKKDVNYSNDQNQILSSNNKITPFNYNNVSNFSKKISTQKKQELQNIKGNLNNKNNDIRGNSYEKLNKNSEEKYTFKPQINENSRKMYEKKLTNFNNINNNNNQPGKQNQTTRPEILLLYENANIIQNKINQKYIEQNNEIISRANKKKINKNSYNMVNNRLNKRIDNAINKFQNDFKLNIVNMAQCLYELNIIIELIKPKDNIKDININNQLDLAELQAMAESVSDHDIKKSEEVELIEQLWYLLNPKLEQDFNCEILSIFLKLFFCDNYTPKELEAYITSLLDNYKINNLEKKEEYKSPLRDKKYDKNGIWPLSKFIKIFLNLKKNLKAYRENDYTKGDLYYNIIKEKDKELTFEPDFEKTSKYFYKHSNFQYNKDISIINLINKFKKKTKQKHDFNKVYERFKAEKERHEKTLQRIREIEEEKELKMCTNVPKINKYKIPNKSPIKDQSKENNEIFNTEEKLQKNKSFIKQPRYKLLYNLRKKYDKNQKEIRIDKDDILDENCTFKPKIGDVDIMNKTFSNIKKSKKPKGFNDYVNRNRSLLEKKEHEKKLEEDKRYGRGYDKLQKMKIKPLNITFSNKSASKPKKNNKYINNTETKRKNRYNLENDKRENIIDNIYITIDVKVSNGAIKPLKIYNKSDKETIDNISNFCKIYRFNEETKRMLIKKALKLKYNFFGKNIENSRERFIMGEDLDTITNTYSNDGNI